MNWVTLTETAFAELQGNKGAMKSAHQAMIDSLTNLIKLVQGELTKPQRQKAMCLITMDTHSRDIIGKLVDESVGEVDAFQWQSQLKPYWDTTQNDCRLRIADAVFWYGYEYLGNGPRLVVTPLTDRI